jgi:hypothetical protein
VTREVLPKFPYPNGELFGRLFCAPGSEVPVGDPWEVVLPTTLVKLRSDGKLPEWMKVPDPNDPNGVRMIWVPAIRDAKGKLSPDPNPQ